LDEVLLGTMVSKALFKNLEVLIFIDLELGLIGLL
jgi:hypothetical protein